MVYHWYTYHFLTGVRESSSYYWNNIAGDAVMYSYIGLAVGDLCSGFISQLMQSRKKVVLLYIFMTLVMMSLYLFTPGRSVFYFYVTCFPCGVGIGYWALFVTIAAEQFGTNLRSTVATSVPNFIRGTVVPLTLAFRYLREVLGGGDSAVIYGALIVGLSTIIIALIALRAVQETFGRDMNLLKKTKESHFGSGKFNFTNCDRNLDFNRFTYIGTVK